MHCVVLNTMIHLSQIKDQKQPVGVRLLEKYLHTNEERYHACNLDHEQRRRDLKYSAA